MGFLDERNPSPKISGKPCRDLFKEAITKVACLDSKEIDNISKR